MESRVLQEDVGARSSDGERRGADQLNLELRRRIPIGVALQDPADISELARRKRAPPKMKAWLPATKALASIAVRSIWSPIPVPAPVKPVMTYSASVPDGVSYWNRCRQLPGHV